MKNKAYYLTKARFCDRMLKNILLMCAYVCAISIHLLSLNIEGGGEFDFFVTSNETKM